ncbi:sulfite exporter TauE/SafE family protein [Blastochloris sulfoviridis]|nr:sulfite exporter TauE/SafE family protein [Blastochloris sulfoviridis]
MQIYLPIAELPVNVFLILGMGIAVGFISGMFGVGGGFLMTPLLIFVGIPPAVSVVTVTAHMAASSASGAIAYWRKGAIDFGLAGVLLLGGMVGTGLGVWVFTILRRFGQLDLAIGISYVLLLGIIGSLMIGESVQAILRSRRKTAQPPRLAGKPRWFAGLPFRMHFRRSNLDVSVLPVLAIGGGIGFLGAVMGISGGFMLVPALIYLLRVPTGVVLGTSLVLTLATMAAAVLMHALSSLSLDVVLALILMVGGVMGAQFGARAGQAMRGEQLRLLLGLLVLAVGLRFLIDLALPPGEMFTVLQTERVR